MEAIIEQDEQSLRVQVQQARAKAERLAQELRIVDDELEALGPTRQQFQLLEEACVSLEKLERHGIAELFWGEAQEERATEYLQRAHRRLEAFQQEWRELEDRRRSIVASICEHEEVLYLLYDDLYDLQQQEERRKLEWIVEREISELPLRAQVMAWSRGGDDDKRFRKALATALLVCLLLFVVVPMVDLPLPKRSQLTDVPERIAELVREEQRKRALPPPPEVKQPDKEKRPDQKPEQEPQDSPRMAQTDKPDSAPSAGPSSPEAPKKAGILAFSERFASLAKDDVAPKLGLQARIGSADDPSTGRTERAMLTTSAPGSSGGINLASLSRSVGGGGGGGGGMAGVQVTRATSAIGGIGRPGSDRPLSGDGVASSRTDEEIQIVFDRYKAALYRLYNRELRKDPTLRGQMVLRLTIEEDGSVSMCELQSSDMNAPELAVQVVERVKTINFGAKAGVAAITILYPIDFLPAG